MTASNRTPDPPPPKHLVVHGVRIACSLGTANAALLVTRPGRTDEGAAIATVDDYEPLTNVLPFGLCQAPGNPSVQRATAAANGVLTPAPCIPDTRSRWSPGSANLQLDGVPALTASSTLSCRWAGVITIVSPNSSLKTV